MKFSGFEVLSTKFCLARIQSNRMRYQRWTYTLFSRLFYTNCILLPCHSYSPFNILSTKFEIGQARCIFLLHSTEESVSKNRFGKWKRNALSKFGHETFSSVLIVLPDKQNEKKKQFREKPTLLCWCNSDMCLDNYHNSYFLFVKHLVFVCVAY